MTDNSNIQIQSHAHFLQAIILAILNLDELEPELRTSQEFLVLLDQALQDVISAEGIPSEVSRELRRLDAIFRDWVAANQQQS